MEITFIRHGKSVCVEKKPITLTEFKEWVGKYDHDGVMEEESYPTESCEKVTKANVVFTSDLTRSIQSAKLLKPDADLISNPVFREVELPSSTLKFRNVKLRPRYWLVILRLLWFFGYSKDCESIKRAKKRAVNATDLLLKTAKHNDRIVLVGHGFFNMMVAKELQKHGLKGNRKTNPENWKCTTYKLGQ